MGRLNVLDFIIILVIVALIAFAFGTADAKGLETSLGITSDYAPGAECSTPIQKLDIAYYYSKELNPKWSFEYGPNYTALYTADEIYHGVGYNIGINYSIKKELDVFFRSGLLCIHKGGEIDGLADSSLYGNLEAGLKYKCCLLKVGHNSSPFHHANEGDSGINFVFIGLFFEI